MENLRKLIDNCDNKIIEILKERMEISKKIGDYKKQNNLPIYNQKREQEIMDNLKTQSSKLLTEETIENIYKEIFTASKKIQE